MTLRKFEEETGAFYPRSRSNGGIRITLDGVVIVVIQIPIDCRFRSENVFVARVLDVYPLTKGSLGSGRCGANS